MSWLQNIQAKPKAQKIKLMWAVVIIVAVIMVIVWVISVKFRKNTPADTTLFQTIGRGFKDVRDNYGKK